MSWITISEIHITSWKMEFPSYTATIAEILGIKTE